MARFHGAVGYAVPYEYEPGIWKDRIEERNHFGTITQHARRWVNAEGINDNLALTNQINILADDYAYEHCSAIKYVRWMGACWKVESMKVSAPRILLTLGGVWNGQKAEAAE